MTDHNSFFRRSEAIMALYSEGKYLDALKVNEQIALEFPDEAATTSLWHMCLLSRADRVDDALKAMSDGLGKGLWWSEEQLRNDEDLAPLQGLPAFELMVAECRMRRSDAQKDSKPGMLVRFPAEEPPYPPYPVLMALHGRRSSPSRDEAYWEPILDMGWMLAMPQSSQLGSPGAFVWDGVALARPEIASGYRQLLDSHPIDRGWAVLAGFSQGASLAMEISIGGLIPACGFLAVAPGRFAIEELEPVACTAHGLRGYLVVGGRDPRYDFCAELRLHLNRNGIPCEMENHPEMGHEFPQNFGRSIAKALEFLLA